MVRLSERVDGLINDLQKRALKERAEGRFSESDFKAFNEHCEEILKIAKSSAK